MTVPEQLPMKTLILFLRFSRTTGELAAEQVVPLMIPSGAPGLPSASHGLLAGGVGEAGDAAGPPPPPPQPAGRSAATARHTTARRAAAGRVSVRAAAP